VTLTAPQATKVLVFRSFLAYRSAWHFFLTGFLEPVFYLLSIGIGVGKLVTGFDFAGHQIGYAEFVASGMLAVSAMNGAMLDSTFNFFFKLKFDKLFDQQLATPLTTLDVARGELAWSLLRGGIYSTAFLIFMAALGYVDSWWGLLIVPATLLLAAGFGACFMALTTFMKSWQDFEFVTLATMPFFLFSATFFPLSAFSRPLQIIVECTPLYRGVVLTRELATGYISWDALISVVYLSAMLGIGLLVCRRRLDTLLRT
jgi:lipooligosaccharide transport system permease protein